MALILCTKHNYMYDHIKGCPKCNPDKYIISTARQKAIEQQRKKGGPFK